MTTGSPLCAKAMPDTTIKAHISEIIFFIFNLNSAALYFNCFYKFLSNKKLPKILPCQIYRFIILLI